MTEALPTWTPELVRERMIAAFRRPPRVPVRSHRGDVPQPAPVRPRPAGPDLVALSSRYLARTSDERRFLLAWAGARASGRSVREICREMRWPRENFRRKRHRACRAIADGLNRDGVPAF